VHLSAAAAVFGLVFLGELPDKTMFASLVLAARGRPGAVWTGAALAFLVHVAIAVSAGTVLFHLLPRVAVDAVVAALFLAGAVYSWLAREDPEEEQEVAAAISRRRTVATAAGVIFLAEWGDLTQVLTANLALRYHAPLTVAVGAVAALWAVAALAVSLGPRLLGLLSARDARAVAAVVLLALTGVTAWQAAQAARM
jgi:putative Ca2+/H+ antiporter (TMEM165/GDT1 family)